MRLSLSLFLVVSKPICIDKKYILFFKFAQVTQNLKKLKFQEMTIHFMRDKINIIEMLLMAPLSESLFYALAGLERTIEPVLVLDAFLQMN